MPKVDIYELVPYDVALLAKQKGFEGSILTNYNEKGEQIERSHWFSNKELPLKQCIVPTYLILNRWLLQKHNYNVGGLYPVKQDYIDALNTI